MFKVPSQQLRDILATAFFEKHSIVEEFTDMDQDACLVLDEELSENH